jgi:pimeloyl-ACP methyl ester carboxylesterase
MGMALFKSRNDLDALAAVIRAFPGFLVSPDALRDNRVPALSIVGETDPLTANVDQLHATLGNHAVVRIPGAGHGDAPRKPEFLEALEGFLANPAAYVTESTQPQPVG